MENSVLFWGLLIILVGTTIAIVRRPDISFAVKMAFITTTMFVSAFSILIRAEIQTENKESLNWNSFVQEHNCKVVERGVQGGFKSEQTGWLCDDGVKYYKPKSYSK